MRAIKALTPLKQKSTIRRLSMHNPMFPERARPSLEQLENASKKAGEVDDSFLSRHGGKVALGAFGATVYLIYTYYKGGVYRSEEEEKISRLSPIEPLEANEFRAANHFESNQYVDLISKLSHSFPNGVATYGDFIASLKSHVGSDSGLNVSHLFDRVVYQHLLTKIENENINAKNSSADQSTSTLTETQDPSIQSTTMSFNSTISRNIVREVPLPLPFYFVALNLAVGVPAEERTDLLFNLAAEWLDNKVWDAREEETLDNSNSNNNSSSSNSNSEDVESGTTPELSESISKESAAEIVANLCASWQVPAVKRVKETGVKYPITLWRQKEPMEMVDSFMAASKPPLTGETKLTREQFHNLILGSHVCAWGECYRAKPL